MKIKSANQGRLLLWAKKLGSKTKHVGTDFLLRIIGIAMLLAILGLISGLDLAWSDLSWNKMRSLIQHSERLGQSENVLCAIDLCVHRGETNRALQIIDRHVAELHSSNKALMFLDAALSREALQKIRASLEDRKIALYESSSGLPVAPGN